MLDLSDSLLSPALFLTITKRLSAKDMRTSTLVLHRALGDCHGFVLFFVFWFLVFGFWFLIFGFWFLVCAFY